MRQCLNSIASQLHEDSELIIIDGGSTDDTSKIIDDFKSHISYYISEPDKGIYDAWNKGVKAAKGDWVAFIGADDILLPHAIEKYMDAILHTSNISEYDYICAHNEFVDLTGKFLKKIGNEPKWEYMRKGNAAAHVASLHNRKNLFGEIGYYDLNYKISADYELLVRKKDKLKYLYLDDVVIARMKVGGMSFSTAALVEVYKIRKKHNCVSPFVNVLTFCKDMIAFKRFVLKNKMKGAKV